MSFVYVLTNEAMPGLVKIGMTADPVEKRMRDLHTSGVPLPFDCFYAARVNDVARVEKALHQAFGDHRENPRREFFRVDPYKVKVILELLAIEDVTPKGEILEDASESQALADARKRRSRFSFSAADIAPGATLTFSKGDGITATVLDDTHISFQGESMSLSGAAATILSAMGYSGSVAGTEYWTYDDETLAARRIRLEGEEVDN